ncbi:hypothetical protein SprV_0301240200 [Sparganum proliferum]
MFFPKVDLVHASHHIPVDPEDDLKSAVTASFDLFEFICRSLGLRYATQTLQRFIEHVLPGLPFVFSYIDDFLVASQNTEEHKERLALVFDRLDKFGVVINPSRCVLAIRDFPPPTSKRQLQRSLGMVDFYRRLLPNCADLMLPLTNMLSGPKDPVQLTGEALTTFEKIKSSLADATLFTPPAPEAQLSLMVDASTVAVGAVLPRHLAGWTRPLALFLRKALSGETR